MQIFSKNLNNALNADRTYYPAFKGDISKVSDSVAGTLAVARRASCPHGGFSEIYNNLAGTTLKKAPELIENVEGLYIPKDETLSRKLIEAGRDFLELPLDWVDDILSHFPDSKLNNLGILQKHREHIAAENKVKAFHGLFDYGSDVLANDKVNKKLLPPSPTDECLDECREVCSGLTDQFNERLNKAAELNKSIYDGKKERFDTRMISGLTGALFLGNDFYNSAILKGKSNEDAEKAKRKKQGQEIKENLIEGFAQYGVMACFAKLSQSNIWFNVASGVGVSTVARILSRKMSGMRLTRMKAPEHSMNEFVKAAKNNESYKTQSERDEEAKKPILSLKNIFLGCAAIIGTGFALKKMGSTTTIGKNITGYINSIKEKSYKSSIEDIMVRPYELQNMAAISKKYGEDNFGSIIESIIKGNADKTLIDIGEKYKVIKLPGGITITKRALKKAALTPFSMVKEFITYPYKLASKFTNAIADSQLNNKIKNKEAELFDAKKQASMTKNSFELRDALKNVARIETNLEELKEEAARKIKRTGSQRLHDRYNIKNIYLRYKKYEEKFGSDPQRLEEEFGKYIQKLRTASMNNQTSSKIDNSQIAVLAGITGTLSGMWFNMNDEYNAAIRNGDNKQEAEKAARKRGLNKFARMTSQVAISGALNKLFRAQYQGSLIGAGIVVAVSTVLTDTVSRLLTAMPTKKMNKAELEQYQENHKNGKMAWYYNLIDKLAS